MAEESQMRWYHTDGFKIMQICILAASIAWILYALLS